MVKQLLCTLTIHSHRSLKCVSLFTVLTLAAVLYLVLKPGSHPVTSDVSTSSGPGSNLKLRDRLRNLRAMARIYKQMSDERNRTNPRRKNFNFFYSNDTTATLSGSAPNTKTERQIPRGRDSSYDQNMSDIAPEVIDDSGAMAYLQDFHEKFGKGTPFKANPSNMTSITDWWEGAAMIAWYINPPTRHDCGNLTAYGNWYVCQDEPYVVKSPCLVYSFGIGFDFMFDDAMGRLGCQVVSFDPSMGVEDHVRSPNVTFYNIGLGSYNTNSMEPERDFYVRRKQIWKVRTLKSLMDELGHSRRVIDVLKADIETSEWSVLGNLLGTDMLKYVRHFLVEFHLFPGRPPKNNYVHFYKLITRLRRLGFREYRCETCCLRTFDAKSFNYQGHVAYVNVNFQKPD